VSLICVSDAAVGRTSDNVETNVDEDDNLATVSDLPASALLTTPTLRRMY